MTHEPAIIDFETRSACDIRDSGNWKYSQHPSTEILCLGIWLPSYPADYVDLWHPAFPAIGLPEEGQEGLLALFDWILSGGLVEAHNSFMEYSVWKNICVPRLGWPDIPLRHWRCSAAKAATHSLPRGLDVAGKALKLKIRKDTSKDANGDKIVLKVSKPRKPRKKERETWLKSHSSLESMPLLWWETPELFHSLFSYCKQDVRAEHALSAALPDLPPQELQVFLTDLTVNVRGFAVDRPSLKVALDMIQTEETTLLAEFGPLTGGSVESPTQRAKLMGWFQSQGFDIPNTQKGTIDDILKSDYWMGSTTPEVKRVMEILRQLGASSTAKYRKAWDWLCDDGRVHGGLLYHGASTGRWSGKGVQPHNFPKGDVKRVKELGMDTTWEILLSVADRQHLEAIFDRPSMSVLAAALRGIIRASDGKLLYVADYAGIEARVLLWLAEDDDALGIFHRGEDIYCSMAEAIYGYPCNKKDNPRERDIGKIAVLGLGYQMGASKFVATAELGGVKIDDEFSQQVVDAYRTKFWRVKEMWYAQEAAAIDAVANPDDVITCGRMAWQRNIDASRGTDFLYCTLPSGRKLAYAEPQIRVMETSWGSLKNTLTFMAVDPKTHQWTRQKTYGGMIVENQTQAVARDILAHAFVACGKSKTYTPVLTVHDEIVAEAHPLQGNIREFERLLTTLPGWAKGCPIAAEGFVGKRYRK